jgi:hypothetical protein
MAGYFYNGVLIWVSSNLLLAAWLIWRRVIRPSNHGRWRRPSRAIGAHRS